MKKQTASVSRVVKYFILLLLLLAVVSAVYKIVATMRYNEIRDYQMSVSKFEYGEIRARLMGTYQDISKNRTILGTPYKLFVSVKPDGNSWEKVVVDKVELINTTDGNIVFHPSDRFETELEAAEHETPTGFFEFVNLPLEYSEYELRIKLRLEGKQSSPVSEITLILHKDYKEYWSNRIWDRMMSI